MSRAELVITAGAEMTRALVAHFAMQNVVHSVHQDLRLEGLLDEVPSVIEDEPIFAVTGHEHHPHFRPQLLQLLRQLRPGYPRHHHVGKQQVDGPWKLAFDLYCGSSIGGHEHLEATFFQRVLNQPANFCVVFDEENSLWHHGGWSYENHLMQVKSYSRTPEWVARLKYQAAFRGGYEF